MSLTPLLAPVFLLFSFSFLSFRPMYGLQAYVSWPSKLAEHLICISVIKGDSEAIRWACSFKSFSMTLPQIGSFPEDDC